MEIKDLVSTKQKVTFRATAFPSDAPFAASDLQPLLVAIKMNARKPIATVSSKMILSRDGAVKIFLHKYTVRGYSSLSSKSIALAATHGISAKTVRDIWCGRSWLDATYDLWQQVLPDTPLALAHEQHLARYTSSLVQAASTRGFVRLSAPLLLLPLLPCLRTKAWEQREQKPSIVEAASTRRLIPLCLLVSAPASPMLAR
jgi:hypothetical protein